MRSVAVVIPPGLRVGKEDDPLFLLSTLVVLSLMVLAGLALYRFAEKILTWICGSVAVVRVISKEVELVANQEGPPGRRYFVTVEHPAGCDAVRVGAWLFDRLVEGERYRVRCRHWADDSFSTAGPWRHVPASDAANGR